MAIQRTDVIQFTCLICVAAVSGELEINALLDTCPITTVQGFISIDATDDLLLPLDSLSTINHRMYVRTNPPWIVQSSGNDGAYSCGVQSERIGVIRLLVLDCSYVKFARECLRVP